MIKYANTCPINVNQKWPTSGLTSWSIVESLSQSERLSGTIKLWDCPFGESRIPLHFIHGFFRVMKWRCIPIISLQQQIFWSAMDLPIPFWIRLVLSHRISYNPVTIWAVENSLTVAKTFQIWRQYSSVIYTVLTVKIISMESTISTVLSLAKGMNGDIILSLQRSHSITNAMNWGFDPMMARIFCIPLLMKNMMLFLTKESEMNWSSQSSIMVND